MANTSSAKKAARQNKVARSRNLKRKSELKSSIKKILGAIEQKNTHVDDMLKNIAAQLARAKGKGLIHKNTASRKLSRIAKKVAAITQKQQV